MHMIVENGKLICAMGKLIIDGNSVYEIDEECLKNRRVPDGCKVQEAIARMEEQQAEKKMGDHRRWFDDFYN